MKRNRRITTLALLLSFFLVLSACGGGGGGGGGTSTPSTPSTTTVSGKVTLSNSVSSSKPQKSALEKLLSGVYSSLEGTAPLSGATVELYNADKPEWLHPVARVLTDAEGSYQMNALMNASGNSNAYKDGDPIPAGKYTILAYRVDMDSGKWVVAVQPYVKKFENNVVGNNLVAVDDSIEPKVVTMFGLPENNAGSFGGDSALISENAKIQMTFNMPMARLSVLNAAKIVLKTNPSVPINGKWQMTPDLLSAQFLPTAPLIAGDVYDVSITTDAKSIYGIKIPTPVAGTFTVIAQDTTKPNARKFQPASQTGVPITTPISIAANEPLDLNTFSIVSTPVIGAKPGVIYAGKNDGTGEYIYQIIPDGVLTLFTDYEIVVSGAKDLAGHEMSPLTMNFKTEAVSSAPQVIATYPVNLQTDLPGSFVITAEFSESMKAASINNTTFFINGDIKGSVSYKAPIASLILAQPLKEATTYTVTIKKNVQDLAGNSMENDKVWSFSTKTSGDFTPPTVVSTTPANLATEVPTNTAISVIFGEAVTNVNTATFQLWKGAATVAGIVSGSGSSYTFTPSAALTGGADYIIVITNGVKDSSGNSMIGNYSTSFKTAVPDTTPPTVVSTSPANGAVNIATTAKIIVNFNEPMDPATINGTNIAIAPSTAGNWSTSQDQKSALFTPSSPDGLISNTTYTVTVSTGVKDTSNNALASPHTWSFKITNTDVTPPSVVSTSPVNNAVDVPFTGTVVQIVFSENVTNVSASTFGLYNGMTQIPGTVTGSNTTWTFTPSQELPSGAILKAVVMGGAGGVKDTNNNNFAGYEWSFTVKVKDVTPPYVKTKNPANGATNFPITGAITATFSEAVTGVSASTFTMVNAAGSPVAGTVSYNALTMQATFTPNASLLNSTVYTVNITSGVKDLAGNALTSPAPWSFTTSAPLITYAVWDSTSLWDGTAVWGP